MRQNVSFRFGGPLTPAVKALIITNIIVFVVQSIVPFHLFLSDGFLAHLGSAGVDKTDVFDYLFGLSPHGVLDNLLVWQPFTYMFLHGGFLHILLNLLGIWMFAGDLETRWGTARFLRFYLISGTGAGLIILLANSLLAGKGYLSPVAITVGASGALFALLLAYGMTWPDREVLIWFLFPIKMKYFVMIFGGIEFLSTLKSFSPDAGNISHVGHVGGLLTGFVLMMLARIDFRSLFGGSRHDRLRKRNLRVVSNRNRAKEIIDRLLDKIARDGMDSLTSEERRELDWARKNYYPDEQDTLH